MRVPALLFLILPADWGSAMLDAETAVLLQKILDEVCAAVSRDKPGARAHVESKRLESASNGQTSAEALKLAGRRALADAPTMWR
jgi:hypothetical protein